MSFAVHLTVLAAVFASITTCPSEEWTPYFNGKCYRTVNFLLPWYAVGDVCNYGNPGAEPVSVHDLMLNSFLAETVAGGDTFWLGLRRANTSSVWAWSDESPVNFTNWFTDQPSEEGEQCAVINFGKIGEWATTNCRVDSWSFMCQIDDGFIPVDPELTRADQNVTPVDPKWTPAE